MTFKYSLTFPISGGNKVSRFEAWAQEHAPGIAFVPPPQTPIKSEAMTIRVQSLEDRQLLMSKLSGAAL